MKLKIYKNISGKYEFSLGSFNSKDHSYLIPDFKKNYDYAYEILRDANELVFKKSYHLNSIHKFSMIEDLSKPIIEDEKAEERLIGHYKNMLKEMKHKLLGIEDNPEEDKKIEYLVLKSQVEDVLKIQNHFNNPKYDNDINKILNGYRELAQKYFKKFLDKDKKQRDQSQEEMIPNILPADLPTETGDDSAPDLNNLTMASLNKYLDDDALIDLFNHYGDSTCQSICKNHPDAIYNSNINKNMVDIIAIDTGDVILSLCINDCCHVENIIPGEKISELYPNYSPKFYQKYWKPIVESIGHFFIKDCDALIIPSMSALPDISDVSCECILNGWNPKISQEKPLSLNFNQECPIWIISEYKNDNKKYSSHQNYTEEDFLKSQPTRVMCIDKKLDLYGKIGEVTQIIPINDGIGFEVDVNFGRKIVRLSDEQIRIVDDYSSH
jgi:hypothetical protein